MGKLTQWDFDIALMKLETLVEYTKEISPICIPPHGYNMAELGKGNFLLQFYQNSAVFLICLFQVQLDL